MQLVKQQQINQESNKLLIMPSLYGRAEVLKVDRIAIG
jgi:hypothetical protein